MIGRVSRLFAWFVALALGLVVTIWLGYVTGWLGDGLAGRRAARGYVHGKRAGALPRVVAIASVWALFTALFSLLLKATRTHAYVPIRVARSRRQAVVRSRPSVRAGVTQNAESGAPPADDG